MALQEHLGPQEPLALLVAQVALALLEAQERQAQLAALGLLGQQAL